MIFFFEESYPSKVFMPALGVKTATFHRWADCGYIRLNKPGTGRSVFLYGDEILYAGCLVLLSKAGHSQSQMHLRGLRDCVTFFKDGLYHSDDKPFNKIPTEYALFKFVERGVIAPNRPGVVDGEWTLSRNPFEKSKHITEAFGHKAEPYFAAINLTDLLKRLVLKIVGIEL